MPPKKQGNPKANTPKGKAKATPKPKVNQHVADLMKIQEARRKQMQADREREQKEKIKQQIAALERKKKEDEEKLNQIKKEKEKTRKKENRSTKAERQEEQRKNRALEEFKRAGIEFAGLNADADTKEKTMTDAQRNRLRKQQKEQAEKKKAEEQARKEALEAERAAAAAAAAPADEDDDDWEKLLGDEEEDEEEKEQELSDEDTTDLPMDDESIMERHNKRMRQTIRRTIRQIQEAQKESSSTIASVSIASSAHAASLAASADASDDADDEVIDEKSFPLRSPIVCILGHVDVGKTKILDKLRQTNVQTGEAGGITQQIGATFFPVENIRHAIRQAERHIPASNYDRVPGLLIIDTPGHESFTNLRSRGSSMCNLAILVVDIMHSLEPQTLESLRMILDREVPFVIALNKIDVLTGWVPSTVRNAEGEVDRSFTTALNSQSDQVRGFFEDRLQIVINDLAHQGVNAALYTDTTKDFSDYVRIVPTSAKTGEGLPDLLANLLSIGQTELEEEIRVKPVLQATVMEIKTITGLGTTADVILANGTLSEGDSIVVCGTDGPIVSQIRSLLTPHPMKEIRVKTDYLNHKSIMASIGVKVCAAGLENALAGSELHVIYDPEEEEVLCEKVQNDFDSILGSFEREETGTYVVASTVGSLEALVTYLKSVEPPVPIANVSVGPVHKRDVMKATVMLEKNPQMAVILAFDVPIDDDAREEAEKQNVQIFTADIIYRLTDQFNHYLDDLKEAEEERRRAACIYPARLSVIRCFHESDPVIVGVHVDLGRLQTGVPIVGLAINKAAVEKYRTRAVQAGQSNTQAAATALEQATREAQVFEIGVIDSIEKDKTPMRIAEKGAEVAIKIGRGKNAVPQFGKRFNEDTIICTKYDRPSIDYIKEKQKELFDLDPQLRSFVASTRALLGIAPPTKAVAPPS